MLMEVEHDERELDKQEKANAPVSTSGGGGVPCAAGVMYTWDHPLMTPWGHVDLDRLKFIMLIDGLKYAPNCGNILRQMPLYCR